MSEKKDKQHSGKEAMFLESKEVEVSDSMIIFLQDYIAFLLEEGRIVLTKQYYK